MDRSLKPPLLSFDISCVQVYNVGVHATHSFEASFSEYNETFAEYLTATAGQRFDPPIRFQMIPYTFDGIFEHALDHSELDFMFSAPSVYSCVGIEVGASALGTIITHEEVRDKVWDLDVYAVSDPLYMDDGPIW